MFSISRCFTNWNSRRIVACNDALTFGWQMESDKNNTKQTSYKITLLNKEKDVLWETEQIQSSQSFNIEYEGPRLESRKEYFWRAAVWNNYGEKAESESSAFEMGLLYPEDWHANWIEADMPIKSKQEEFNPALIFSYQGENTANLENLSLDPPVVFQKSFSLSEIKVKKARIYITARGIYEASLNGERIGDEFLAPGFTTYPKLQYYQTYDIIGQIKSGDNRVVITVADGWYKGRIGLAGIGHQFGDKVALLAQIEIEYENGKRKIIGTDDSFQASTGEIEYSDLFIGEKQDHTKKTENSFKVIEKEYGFKQLKADFAEPVKCSEKLQAVKILKTPKGETVIDFGRNIAGIVEMKTKGAEGEVIQLQHAEELDADGNFFFNIMGQNKHQIDTYVLKGGEEVCIPKFTYHGFRYVKVVGYTGEIKRESFTAWVLSSACERAGSIVTSNPQINQLLQNIYHSQESNFISVPTDCPQREKGGWTGDAQIYTPTAIFNMNIHNFMKRWLENMRLEQYENGQIPGLIPWIESDRMLSGGFGNISCAGWADACILIPWYLFVQYEDISFLKDNYEMMKRWISYVETRCASNTGEASKEYDKYLWDMDFHYGDWFTPSLKDENGRIDPMKSAKMTGNQVATMYFAHSAELLSRIAGILGKEVEADYYSELSSKVKKAFVLEYTDSEGKIQGNLQGLYTLAAHFKMGSDELNKKFADRLEQLIRENGNKLDTGFLGTPILLDVLTNYGKKELSYKLLLQDECPSWLYMVKQGATSIWESWDAIKPDGMRNITSFNHYSLGSVQDYIVREIGGLAKSWEGRGKYILKPDLSAPIHCVSLSYESPYGIIEIERDANQKSIKIKVPVGAVITVRLPGWQDKELGSGIHNVML